MGPFRIAEQSNVAVNMKWILFFLICSASAKNIDIITNWLLTDMEIVLPQERVHVFYRSDYHFSPETDAVIVMNPCIELKDLATVPQEKRFLFTWEPEGASPSYCEAFSRVYTF